MKTLTARGWLVLRAMRPSWNHDIVNGLRIKRLTINKPQSIGRDEVAMRIELTLPEALFTRPALQASITVPEGEALTGEVLNAIAEAAPTLIITVREDQPEEAS